MTVDPESRRYPWALALVILGVVTTAGARETAPGVWDRLRETVSRDGEQLRRVLREQDRMEAREQTLEGHLERGRRLRAMHREAVLLSELNVAWIRDQLDHWDCRVAQQKVLEARSRVAELETFGARLESLCGGLGAGDPAQRQVCARQRSELSGAVAELEGLGQRYAGECPSQAGSGAQSWR